MLVDGDQVWVGTATGLDRLDPQSGRRVQVLPLAGPMAPGQALARDADGTIWFGSRAGLFRIHGKGKPARSRALVRTRQ